jgi:hypothetical protein
MGLNTQGVLLISKHSFTLEEVQFLSAMLNSKFKLNTVADKGNGTFEYLEEKFQ